MATQDVERRANDLAEIKAEMVRQGVRQAALAAKAGAAPSLVSAVFTGRRGLTDALRDKLRRALGLPEAGRPLAGVPTAGLEDMLDLGDQE